MQAQTLDNLKRGRGRPRTNDHGTAACYKRGCREAPCKRAWADYKRTRDQMNAEARRAMQAQQDSEAAREAQAEADREEAELLAKLAKWKEANALKGPTPCGLWKIIDFENSTDLD